MTPNSIYQISVYLSYVLDISLFVLCLIFCFKSNTPDYLNYFIFIPSINIAIDIAGTFGPYLKAANNPILFSICRFVYLGGFPAEIIFFFILISSLTPKSPIKKVAWVLIIFEAFLLLIFAVNGNVAKIISLDYSTCGVLGNIAVILLCFLFYRSIFKEPFISRLSDLPSFWLVSGIFFFTTVLIIVWMFAIYFEWKKMHEVANIIFSAFNYFQIVSFCLFIKAITCQAKLPTKLADDTTDKKINKNS